MGSNPKVLMFSWLLILILIIIAKGKLNKLILKHKEALMINNFQILGITVTESLSTIGLSILGSGLFN